jgi:hypothetical protein
MTNQLKAEAVDAKTLSDIASRWDGVSKGHHNLTFDKAQADMQTLLSEARKVQKMREEVELLKAHVRKRNADMQAFASEVTRLATQKYSDYMDLGKGTEA